MVLRITTGGKICVVSLVALGLTLCACSGDPSANNTMNVDENLTTTDIGAASVDAAPAAKTHNYQDRDGNTYEYVSAVSDEDAKKGKAVGDVSLFEFRGVFDGRYRISVVDNDGRTEFYYECSNPCGVIKAYKQGHLIDRVPYGPTSIIGAAFDDAFNGFLQVSKETRTSEAASSVAPATPSYGSPPATAEPQQRNSEIDNNSAA